MGKLLQVLGARLEQIRNELNEAQPEEVGKDPKKAVEYIKRKNDLQYLDMALGMKAVDAIRRLPKEKQDEFYEKCISEEQRDRFTKKVYGQRLDPNNSTGRTSSYWLTGNKAFGQDWHKTLETLEEMIGPEEVDRVIAELDDVKVPGDPSLPAKQMLSYPMADAVREIKDSLDPAAPETEADRIMLDEVNEELAVVEDSVRDHIDKLDNRVAAVKGFQATFDGFTFDMANRFIKQQLEGGKYKDKIPASGSPNSTDGTRFAANAADAGNLSAEDVEALKKLKPAISALLKADILTITNKMDAMGKQHFRIPDLTTKPIQGGAPGEEVFNSEQGYKFYAYWPLYVARGELAQAVSEKDLPKIRAAHERYKSIRKDMDDMLAIVHKHPTGLCSGNINSTRELPDGIANPMPLEHMTDFVGHSQVNGIFLLYASADNLQTTPEKLLDDPVGIMADAGEKYVEKYGLNSRKTTGEKLRWGLSTECARARFKGSWGGQFAMCLSRAFDSVACLADDPAERDRIAGVGQMAVACGSVPVNEHGKKWEKLAMISDEQRKVLYQHAALIPEEEFDPLEYAELFSQPDWKEKTDTDALIDRLKREGKLNYSELAERVDKIVADSMKVDQAPSTGYDSDEFIHTSHKLYEKILEKAGPEERNAEGFGKFAESVGAMLTKTSDFEAVQDKMHRELDAVQTEKKGLFLSSENSEEHDKMVRAQNTFRYKLMQMQGKKLPDGLSAEDRAYLKTVDLQTAYDNAREKTFDYCSKKTDNGRSLSFSHNVGRVRFRSAMRSIACMDALADGLKLRSPAQKMIDKVREDVLLGRSKNGWTPEKTEKAAAKLMYAMSVEHQTADPEEQAKRLDPKRVEMGIAYIRNTPAFKKMVKNEGLKDIADHIAEGHGKFTDGFVRGMNSAAKERNEPAGKNPKNMTAEEKGEVWKNQTLQM